MKIKENFLINFSDIDDYKYINGYIGHDNNCAVIAIYNLFISLKLIPASQNNYLELHKELMQDDTGVLFEDFLKFIFTWLDLYFVNDDNNSNMSLGSLIDCLDSNHKVLAWQSLPSLDGNHLVLIHKENNRYYVNSVEVDVLALYLLFYKFDVMFYVFKKNTSLQSSI
ncbi:MAG: hypothetical protein CME69_12385 [Halobacteriovorax sp.]|nr:hypothetical protein [Halobacteriovorax sp.]|tara:strand:+ start:258 stop:761 length:504 start_codon:yes stop_codon:yes gene_type:complete